MDGPIDFEEFEDADLDDPCAGEVASIGQDWDVVIGMLPAQWEAKAVELGAVRRLRGFDSVGSLLRVLLIHLADGCSLRETAVRASAGGLAAVSDVALLKRLRGCGVLVALGNRANMAFRARFCGGLEVRCGMGGAPA